MKISKICKEYRSILDKYGFSPETVYYYPIELEKFLKFIENNGKKNIEDIDEKDYISYRNHLEDEGYNKKMVIKKMSAVKTWIRLNYERNPTNENFARLYEKIRLIKMTLSKKKGSRGFKPIPFEHFLEILKTASLGDLETKLFVYILATTGGRSQFYGLKLGNIDLENKMLKVFVKGEKYIEVPLIDIVEELIIQHIKMKYIKEYEKRKNKFVNEKEIVKDIIRMHKNDFLFKYGKDVYPDKVSWDRIKKNRRANTKNAERILRRICEKAGLWICINCGKVGAGNGNNVRCDICNKKVEHVYYTPHQIRKSIATYGFDLGLSLEGTSDLLGHSSIEITKKFYRGKQVEKVREELKGMEDLLKKIEENKFRMEG